MISCSRQYLRKEMVKFDRVFGFTLFMLNQIIYDGDIIHCSISLILYTLYFLLWDMFCSSIKTGGATVTGCAPVVSFCLRGFVMGHVLFINKENELKFPKETSADKIRQQYNTAGRQKVYRVTHTFVPPWGPGGLSR